MDGAIIPSLASFVFAATITPGPNNIMVMASGANFGLRRSIPHLLGISVGVLLIIVLAGVGLMAIFDALPSLETVLRVVSTVYLLWLAWKIANVRHPMLAKRLADRFLFCKPQHFSGSTRKSGQPAYPRLPFCTGKGVVCVVLVASAFALIGLASNAIWAWMGTALQRWLIVGRRLQFFNIAMAILLIASLYPVSQH